MAPRITRRSLTRAGLGALALPLATKAAPVAAAQPALPPLALDTVTVLALDDGDGEAIQFGGALAFAADGSFTITPYVLHKVGPGLWDDERVHGEPLCFPASTSARGFVDALAEATEAWRALIAATPDDR